MISQLEKGEEPWLMEREVSGGPSPGKSKADGAFVMSREVCLKASPPWGRLQPHGETHGKPDYHSVSHSCSCLFSVSLESEEGTPFLGVPVVVQREQI